VYSSFPLEWHRLRGEGESVKTAEIAGIGKVAVCNGMAAAQGMLETEAWRAHVAIEVMRRYGPEYVRHRMESAADVDDLAVRTPAGERCRFSIEIGRLDAGGRSRMVIKSLDRRSGSSS
jgi:hypothetical protein